MTKKPFLAAVPIILYGGFAMAQCPPGNTGPCEAWSAANWAAPDIGTLTDTAKFALSTANGVWGNTNGLEILSYLQGKPWSFTNTINMTNLIAGVGTFTTLSASGPVTGAGFTSLFAAPPPIGGTSAAAATFSTATIAGLAGGGTLCVEVNNAGVLGTAAGGCTGTTSPTTVVGTAGQILVTTTSGTAAVSLPSTLTPALTFASAVTFSGSVAGPGLSNYLASPPAIGGGAAAAATFTSVTATGLAGGGTLCVQVNNSGVFGTAAGGCTGTTSPTTVVGTAGQILVTTTSGTAVVSLPSTIAPALTFSSAIAFGGALSGAGLSNYFASPPAIGGTTAAAATFTSVTATGLAGGGTLCVQVNNAGTLGTAAAGCGTGGSASTTFTDGTHSVAATTVALFSNGFQLSGSAGLATVSVSAPDSTKVANYTIGAGDMAGQVNFNGSGITATIGSVSTTIFASGMSSCLVNQNSTPLNLSSVPTLNGLINTTSLYQDGFFCGLGNGTSIDAFGFPGFPGGTTEFLRADGTYAVPPGGSAAPGGSAYSVQYQTASATFGGVVLAAGQTLIGGTAAPTAQSICTSTGVVNVAATAGTSTIAASTGFENQTGTLTSAVTYKLPAASTYPTDCVLIIDDTTGSVSATLTITITPNGSDTINSLASLPAIGAPHFSIGLTSNGSATGNWQTVAPAIVASLQSGQIYYGSTANATSTAIVGGDIALGPLASGTAVATIAAGAVTSTKLATGAAATNIGGFSGDLTGTAPTLTVAANAITNAKMAQAGANTVKGNFTNATANEADNAMPGCSDTLGNHLNYVAGTGLTCGSTSSSGTAIINGQVQLKYTSASAITLAPYNGSGIQINTVGYNIPASGIACANTGVYVNGVSASNLGASTLYYVYAYRPSATIVCDYWSGTAAPYIADTTAGNIGVEVRNNNGTPDSARTLIGLVYTSGASAFVSTASAQQVRSWFQPGRLALVGTALSAVTSGSTTFAELGTQHRLTFVSWAGETADALFSGYANNTISVAATLSSGIGANSTTVDSSAGSQFTETVGGANNNFAAAYTTASLTEGLNYLAPIGDVSGTSANGTWNGAMTGSLGGGGGSGGVGGSGAVTSVSGSSPIVSSGGTTPAISINAATPTAAGALPSPTVETFCTTASGLTCDAASGATFTVPATATLVEVFLCGGGGQGGGGLAVASGTAVSGGAGGGGGACLDVIYRASDLISGSPYTVTLGAGGTTGSGSANGQAGGSSTFGSILTAYGGGGGGVGVSGGASDGGGGGDVLAVGLTASVSVNGFAGRGGGANAPTAQGAGAGGSNSGDTTSPPNNGGEAWLAGAGGGAGGDKTGTPTAIVGSGGGINLGCLTAVAGGTIGTGGATKINPSLVTLPGCGGAGGGGNTTGTGGTGSAGTSASGGGGGGSTETGQTAGAGGAGGDGFAWVRAW